MVWYCLTAAAAEAEAAPEKTLTGSQLAGTCTLGAWLPEAEHALAKVAAALTTWPTVFVPLTMTTGGDVVKAVRDLKLETAVLWGFSCARVFVAASLAITASTLPPLEPTT